MAQRGGGNPSKRSSRKKKKATEANRTVVDRMTTGPLEDEQYYHGLLPREDINVLIKENGDFLVRYTEARGARRYCLSCFWDQPRHFLIENPSERCYRLAKDEPEFPSIPELIKYYVEKKKQLSSKTGAKLVNPIGRAKWEMLRNQIHVGEKLGEGAFGEVNKGHIICPNGEKAMVAIKQSRFGGMSKADIQEMMKETRLMRDYNHPNIVQFYGVSADQEPIMIIMELVTGGGLDKYVQKNADTLTPNQLTKFCLDAANGLAYLHKRGCLHRDVAARNCLITGDGVVKIADFGLSTKQSSYKMNAKKKVPIKWLAPETITSQIYAAKSEVWAFGILMWEVFSEGSDPYPNMTAVEVMRGIIRANYRMSAPEKMPETVRQVMYRCWNQDPNQRPPLEEVAKLLKNSLLVIDPAMIVLLLNQ